MQETLYKTVNVLAFSMIVKQCLRYKVNPVEAAEMEDKNGDWKFCRNSKNECRENIGKRI